MKAPDARDRRPRSFWFDPRFAIGLGLVVASVVGVSALVTSAQHSTTVYAAEAPLVAGETITSADVTATQVRMSGARDLYLTSGDLREGGVVVTRTVAAGELIPVSAVGEAGEVETTSVVVAVSGRLPESVKPGAVVDVWSAAEQDHGTFGPPSVLAASATVVRVLSDDALGAGRQSTGVEVRVPGDDVAAVLAAVANGDAVSVVAHSDMAAQSTPPGAGDEEDEG